MRVAAIQLHVDEPRESMISRAEGLIRSAGAEGAELVLLPELYSLPFVQPEPDPRYFENAEPLDGPSNEMPQRLSRELGISVISSVFERGEQPGVYYNTAVTFAAGELVSVYRKSHLPFSNGFPEKFYFQPGSTPPPVVSVGGTSVGTIICYERHFPELGRLVALGGAHLMCVPVASASEPMKEVFQLELRAHAVFNGFYVLCANRVGTEEMKDYFGLSALYDPDGGIVAQAVQNLHDELVMADVDVERVAQTRQRRPFLRDRRPELYSGLSRSGEPSSRSRNTSH